MAKIKLTKNELKTQKESLKRFARYLPTLELKKKQLLVEIQRLQKAMDGLDSEIAEAEARVDGWVDVFADDAVDPAAFVVVKDLLVDTGNVAGIDIPVFRDLLFEEAVTDLFEAPLWVDRGILEIREQMTRRARQGVLARQKEALERELRITIQRLKLFEEVKIPEARHNIRIIQIFLGDMTTAEVVRGKIAKKKIERKKALEAGAA